MEKIVIFKTNRKFIEKNIVDIAHLINIYQDIDIRFMLDIKPSDYDFVDKYKNLIMIEADVNNIGFTEPHAIANCAVDTFFVNADFLTKVGQDKEIRSEDVVKLIINNKKNILLRLEETVKDFSKNKGSLALINKIFDILGNTPAKQIKQNISFNYHFAGGRNSTTNEHIDDMIKTIRSTLNKMDCMYMPILLSGNIDHTNILSYCVTNNFDGFIIEDKNLSVESMVEVVRMVHGWQRLIRNQIMRRNKK